jgi:hypothetical protein
MLAGNNYTYARRYFLENLATHDVFGESLYLDMWYILIACSLTGCFITGKEPVLLGNFDPWWFESVDRSQTRWEWESVEQT